MITWNHCTKLREQNVDIVIKIRFQIILVFLQTVSEKKNCVLTVHCRHQNSSHHVCSLT